MLYGQLHGTLHKRVMQIHLLVHTKSKRVNAKMISIFYLLAISVSLPPGGHTIGSVSLPFDDQHRFRGSPQMLPDCILNLCLMAGILFVYFGNGSSYLIGDYEYKLMHRLHKQCNLDYAGVIRYFILL